MKKKQSKMLVLVALASTMMVLTASARTINMTVNRSALGLVESFDFTFDNVGAGTTNSLWVVCGTADGGTSSYAAWDSVHFVADVPGDTTSVTGITPPDGWGEGVTHLRFFLSAAGIVPGADRLDYIRATQSGGNQYIMTSFVPKGTSAVETEFAFTTVSAQMCIFCARSGYNDHLFDLFWLSSNWRFDYNSSKPTSTQSPGTTFHKLRADSNGLTMDGTLLAGTTPAASTFTAGSTMSIFAAHRAGVSDEYYAKMTLYSFKVWENGADASTIALDLVPCKRNDVVCLFDKVSGTFLLNEGTGSFTAGSVVAAATDTPENATELVATSEVVRGWTTTDGTFYAYIEPLYVVDVAAGSSNAINEVTFKHVAAAGSLVTNLVGYSDFIAESRTGTILKQGGGTLTFDKDISSFTGPVHVEEGIAIGVCSNCFGHTINDNTARDTQRTYVHSGATLVMDAIGNEPLRSEANAIYYEGDGYPGMGGSIVARNGNTASGTSRWQLGSKSRTAGPASLYVDVPSGAQVELNPGGNMSGGGVVPNSDFSLAGRDLLVYGRDPGSEFLVNHVALAGIGKLVVSNVTLKLANSGLLSPANGADSTIRFCGGARWVWPPSYTGNGQTATVYIDDMGYASVGSTTKNGLGVDPWDDAGEKYYWYNGPIVMNGHFHMYNASAYQGGWDFHAGFTFESQVSGSGGFRPYQNRARKIRLNLLYPTNTFEGGIVLGDESSLGVYGERSVPSQEGAGLVSITNGYVYFGRKVASAGVTNNWVNFTMPVTEFVGAGAVTNGTGTWKGLVKKGTGVLDYNSQLGGAYLDLQGGTVKFSTQYRGAYTGDNAGAAPDGYAAALPVFTTLKGTAGALDLDGVGGAYTVENVEGSPSVVNGNLTVTGNWTVDAATVGTSVANISGTLSFGDGATITVSGDLDSVSHPSGGFVVARAANVSGTPRLIGADGYSLKVANGELKLGKGFVIVFR